VNKRVAILAVVVNSVVAGQAFGQSPWPTYTVQQPFAWEHSTPEEQGLDSAILKKALRKGRRLPYLRAMVIVKDGHLIAERYYRGTTPTDAKTVMSVSKSLVSALAGIAITQRYLSLSNRMLDFFPEYIAAEMDPRMHDITIRHLLTMTSGLPYDDHDDHWSQWMPSSDWVGFCLSLPLDGNPGEVWNYSTCGTHLLSAILTRATGTSTLQFAQENLFEPLGITIGGWRQDPQGYFRGGWDMYFTPRDMARFGYLYLNNGEVDNDRILSRRWVKKTTRPFARGGSRGAIEELGYGYLWWTGRGSQIHKMYFAAGYAGQYIMNIPRLNVTIVATADANCDWDQASVQAAEIRELIADHLLVPLWEQTAPSE